jgi:hypothetical protein
MPPTLQRIQALRRVVVLNMPQVNCMRSVRWSCFSAFLAIASALCWVSQPATAQFGLVKGSKLIEAKEPTSDAKIKFGEMQRGSLRVKGADQKSNLAILKLNAQYYVYRVTYEEYYDVLSSGDLKARPENKSVEGLNKDLLSSILIPAPDNNPKFSIDQGDFIFEYGAALDEAFRTVLSKNPPVLIRTNAARMMATAAKSGAPAHAKTITELLTHKFFKVGEKFVQTPPEVYYYALKAAENLLAAYHPVWHLDPAKLTRHSLKEDELIPFVKLIEEIVLNGPTVMDKAYTPEVTPTLQSPSPPPAVPAKVDPKNPTPPPASAPVAPKASGVLDAKSLTKEQLLVYEYYRRQAVRALAKVRFDIIGGGTPNEIRPAFTLAKIAVSDFSIIPAPSPAEISEAVLGLIGLTPSTNLRIDEWAFIVARGTELMIAPKLESEENQTLPWRVLASRMNVALANLKKTAPVNSRFRPYQQSISKLCDVITSSITIPIEKVDSTGAVKPSRELLAGWMQQNPPKDPGRSLFDDKPEYKLTSRQGR